LVKYTYMCVLKENLPDSFGANWHDTKLLEVGILLRIDINWQFADMIINLMLQRSDEEVNNILPALFLFHPLKNLRSDL